MLDSIAGNKNFKRSLHFFAKNIFANFQQIGIALFVLRLRQNSFLKQTVSLQTKPNTQKI